MLELSAWMKLTRTSDLVFHSKQLMLAIWSELFSMNFFMLLLLIGIITCFWEGPLVVIWMRGLGLGVLLMIFWVLRAENVSLILMISLTLVFGLRACICDLVLVDLKYLEIWLTSFFNLARSRDSIFSMLVGTSFSVGLLLWLSWGMTLGESLAVILSLRDFLLLSAFNESYLNW